jgi:hypothetical protein
MQKKLRISNAAKDKSTDSSRHKKWLKPEMNQVAANQEGRARNRSKKERNLLTDW